MRGVVHKKRILLPVTVLLWVMLAPLPLMASAGEEVVSPIRRYKDREVSTGYYEEYEVLPRREKPFVTIPGVSRGLFPYSPGAAEVRIRRLLADSHRGLKFYENRRCEGCHTDHDDNIHSVRFGITCRQCHGGEPVAGIGHYYSPLNPIRRHAYVCSKCHEGAGASFAGYVIHEPPAGSPATRKSFPLLYYAYWFMVVLLVGTLAFFIPHAIIVGVRELGGRRQ